MRFFLDSANIEEIKQAWDMGVIAGLTTNPSLVAKEGRDFHELLNTVTGIVDGPISAEVIALDKEGMLQEARVLAAIHPNIVVKIPMTEEGLKASKGIKCRGHQDQCYTRVCSESGVTGSTCRRNLC